MTATTEVLMTSPVSNCPRSAGATTDTTDAATACWMTTRINYICDHYPRTKPKHREVSQPLAQPSGEMTTFTIGRLLSDVADCFIEGRAASLGEAGQRILNHTLWFRTWLDRLRVGRGLRPSSKPPSADEQVCFLAQLCPVRQPHRSETLTAQLKNGESYQLSVREVYDHIATGKPKGHASAVFRKLPWARKWLQRSAMQKRLAAGRRVITKELKLGLMLLHFQERRPAHDAIVPICGPGVYGVYEWRAAGWLDDIVDNWCDGATPGVRLSKEQMRALETLPWFEDWVLSVRARRARRE